jgi:ABC-type branched-subunit amino acid transport system ATPase component/branched-subunit amino acid ABC-type transport system permease component
VEHVVFLLLGLANGAVFASLALALVVTYRSSGVINFGTSAIALYASYQYAFLRQGELLVLVPGLPNTIDLGSEVPFLLAVVVALATASLLGLLLYLLIFRPLRTAPAVAKAVASVGILVVITGLMVVRIGTRPINVKDILPTDIWTVGDVRVSSDRVWFAVLVVLVTVVLWAFYKFTGFGLATRAAADTEKGAYLSGLAPDRLAAANWMISAAVAGGAGILIAPIVPLVPIAYSLFIIPALAAAILGRFQHMLPAVLGGLAIGMLQSEGQFLANQHSWLPSSGVPELVPLILILLVLVVRAAPLPGRGTVVQRNLGRAPRPKAILVPAVAATVVGAIGVVLLDGQWRAALITSFIFGIISLSYVVVTGYAGQVSLAQLTLAGAAGFLLGPITTSWDVPFPVAPILAALGAAVIGVVVGLPALRVRGLPVAVVTLALALVLEAMWFRNLDFVNSGGSRNDPPSLFGLDLGIGSGVEFPRLEFGLTVLAILALVAVGVALLRLSRFGSEMLAVRANERAAAAAGVSVVRVKVLAFAIASFIAGIGGSLLGYRLGSVTFESFSVLLGLSVLATAYLAGITSVSGGLLAGLLAFGGIVTKLSDELLGAAEYYNVITGALLIATIVLNPEGIVGPLHEVVQRRRLGTSGDKGPSMVREAGSTIREATAQRQGRSLRVESVTVRYGGMIATQDVSLEVPPGRIVGLIGPNGAGKTTLIDAITGFTPARGDIRLGDQELSGLAPHRRIRAGLGRTFQAIELYDDLSVTENVIVGEAGARARAGHSETGGLERTFELLHLSDLRDRPAQELSQGQRQLVSIARALVGDPEVLLLDEPAGGLDSNESQWLGDRIREIAASGVGVLLIDHDMHLVLDLCDEIQVLDFGRIIASGTPAEIRVNPLVAEAYLGSTHTGEDVEVIS